MGQILLQYDGLQIVLKQGRVLLTTDKGCPGTEGLTESVTMTSHVILHKVRVYTAAGAEDAVTHPVPALLDLRDHEDARVHDGSLAPALGTGGDRLELRDREDNKRDNQGELDPQHCGRGVSQYLHALLSSSPVFLSRCHLKYLLPHQSFSWFVPLGCQTLHATQVMTERELVVIFSLKNHDGVFTKNISKKQTNNYLDVPVNQIMRFR